VSGGEPNGEAINLREQSGERESKKQAERSAARSGAGGCVAEWARSGERRSHKWALTRSSKQ